MSITHVEAEIEKVEGEINEAEEDPRSHGHPRKWTKESGFLTGLKIRLIILKESLDLFNKE